MGASETVWISGYIGGAGLCDWQRWEKSWPSYSVDERTSGANPAELRRPAPRRPATPTPGDIRDYGMPLVYRDVRQRGLQERRRGLDLTQDVISAVASAPSRTFEYRPERGRFRDGSGPSCAGVGPVPARAIQLTRGRRWTSKGWRTSKKADYRGDLPSGTTPFNVGSLSRSTPSHPALLRADDLGAFERAWPEDRCGRQTAREPSNWIDSVDLAKSGPETPGKGSPGRSSRISPGSMP